MEEAGQAATLLPTLIGVGLLLVAMLVVLYFFRGLIRTTKACLILAFLGVLALVAVAAFIILSAAS
jgi:hypothetical protein